MRGCPLSFFVVGIADFGLMGCCGWKANILQCKSCNWLHVKNWLCTVL